MMSLQRLTSGFTSKLTLFGLDLVGLALIFNMVHVVRMGEPIRLDMMPFWVIVLITVIILYVMDVYRTEKPATRARLPLQAFLAVPVASVFSALFVYALGVGAFQPLFGRGVMPASFALFAFWAAFWRWAVTRLHVRYSPKFEWWVVAPASNFKTLVAELMLISDRHHFHHLDSSVPTSMPIGPPAKASGNRWGVLVLNQGYLEEHLAHELMQHRFRGVLVLSISEFFEQYGSRVPVLHLGSGWFVESAGFQWVNDHIGLRLQRLLDMVVSVLCLVGLAPALLLIGMVVRVSSSGPALFVQTRVGLHGKPFQLVKFRTMVAEAEKSGPQWAAKDDPRITPVGRFLRATRIDELPQLWNILKGEMSLIGPRPERPEFVQKLEAEIPFYDLRHMVPPGVTGWAQVMYDYGASVEDARRKLEYDLYYIKNHSIQLDFAIVIKTLLVVFKRAGR